MQSLQELREINICQGLRISIVDNYQGEENDIILLSLVRSNPSGTVGFLKIDNRICVALSRAKQGLFIVGNLEQMCASAPLWQTIRSCLQEAGSSVGETIRLVCQNHADQQRDVKSAEEFIRESPEGGCLKPCGLQIPRCGHTCPRMCHNDNFDHGESKCHMPCKRSCENEHLCPEECFIKCPPCKIVMDKLLRCGHQHKVNCGEKKYLCPTSVEKEIPSCKHKTTMKCHEDPGKVLCPNVCDQLLRCGHQCRRKCHMKDDPNHHKPDCSFPCTKGCANEGLHPCTGVCSDKCPPCKEQTKKKLECGHTHLVECCDKNFLCTTKVSKIIPSCEHKKFMRCQDSPVNAKCDKRCDTRLECGHQCRNPCHVKKDPDHLEYECTAPCSRNNKGCISNHPCKLRCNEVCETCTIKVDKDIDDCGHKAKVICLIINSNEIYLKDDKY